MSNLKKAEEYIGNTRTVILTTVNEGNVPAVRTLASFANDGLTVYLSTAKTSAKVEQLKSNPNAALLFQQEGQEIQQFRNVTLTGTISKVCPKCGDEYAHAVSLLSSRSPRFKERAEAGGLEGTAILKFTPSKLKFLDFSKGTGPAAVKETEIQASVASN